MLQAESVLFCLTCLIRFMTIWSTGKKSNTGLGLLNLPKISVEQTIQVLTVFITCVAFLCKHKGQKISETIILIINSSTKPTKKLGSNWDQIWGRFQEIKFIKNQRYQKMPIIKVFLLYSSMKKDSKDFYGRFRSRPMALLVATQPLSLISTKMCYHFI